MRTSLALLLAFLGACTEDLPRDNLIGETEQAVTTPVLGMPIIYRYDSTHSYAGYISGFNSDSQNLVVFKEANGVDWPFGPNSQASFATIAAIGVIESDATIVAPLIFAYVLDQ